VAVVRRTADAETDLTDIWVYIAADNPAAADRTILALLEAEDRLARFPEIGRLRADLVAGLRSWAAGSYVIFYRPMEDGILTIRILHGARDAGDVFSDP
jgi:toxin ParE1/3/4